MKEIKLISLNGEYFLQASKYFVAEPDAIRGCYIKEGFIIAKDYNDAQALLIKELIQEVFAGEKSKVKNQFNQINKKLIR